MTKAWPDIEKMPAPGDLRTTVNTEELLKLKPDVVIITHYMIEKTGKQIEFKCYLASPAISATDN